VQALESYSTEKKTDSALPPPLPLKDYCGSLIDIHELHKVVDLTSGHPDFKVHRTHLYETSELCEIFFNRWIKYLYLIIVVVFCFFISLTFATIASTAWATNLPLNFGPFQQCPQDAFRYNLLPAEEGCRFTYFFCLMVYGLIVVPLSVVNLREQAIVQTIFGILRVLVIFMIVSYSIVKIIEGENICETLNSSNVSNHSNSSGSCSLEERIQNFTAESVSRLVFEFDPSRIKGWLVAVPVFTYPIMLHHSVPSLTHPIKQKQNLWLFVLCTYGFLGFLYVCLGVVPPLWLKSYTQETISLNWVSSQPLQRKLNRYPVAMLCLYIIYMTKSWIGSHAYCGAHSGLSQTSIYNYS